MASPRSLVVILGDQLDLESSAFDEFDTVVDLVWMAEVVEESTHVWSSKSRITLFLSAMRHFAHELINRQRPLHYLRLDDPDNHGSLAAQLRADCVRLKPAKLVMTTPGDWRVLQALTAVANDLQIPLDVREDRHFLVSADDFREHSRDRKALRLEYFYRDQRKRLKILMDPDSQYKAPLGGQWNFDADNREAFDSLGPDLLASPTRFKVDDITQDVIKLVSERFIEHPGSLGEFSWPVTRQDALQSLEQFIKDRLPLFGRFQDAMWPDNPWLYHAHLSAALNLKLLNPREVIAAAELAYQRGVAPLPSVEGFIRQILGWREYVRCIYWTQMPEYLTRNALHAKHNLPSWYWTGATDMSCLRDVLNQTLTHGYANHIQRLMVTGLFALMFGVEPRQIHEWYLAVYVDAVEWVELPNTLGMSQYADGGVMGSKPYIATGKYIDRMSPYCKTCRYDPGARTGKTACPFTTLYWDFLIRHQSNLVKNPRMALQVKNLARLSPDEKQAIIDHATTLRAAEQARA